MAEPNYGLIGDEHSDDLPRTLRRERDSREREAREREARERAQNPKIDLPMPDVKAGHSTLSSSFGPQADGYGGGQSGAYTYDEAAAAIPDIPFPASVRRFDVSFLHLVMFFIKAVLAAIPALILLTAILWTGGYLAKVYFPELLQMKVLITFPNG